MSDEGENQTSWFELYGVASMVKLYIGKSFQIFVAFPVIMFWRLNVKDSLFNIYIYIYILCKGL